MTELLKITDEMQWRQEEHDRLYHPDIYNLSKHNRLKHLTLHLAKYQGKYLSILREDGDVTNTLVDAIIVLMSIANSLNYRLQPPVKVSGCSSDVVIWTSKLCKCVEAIDHLEDLNYRAEIIAAIQQLLSLWLALPNTQPVTWRMINARWWQVEKKSMFYDDIMAIRPDLKWPLS